MEERSIEVDQFRRALYEKHKEFLNNNEASNRLRNKEDPECFESFTSSRSLLSASERIDGIDMSLLRAVDDNLVKMTQDYEKYLRLKALDGETISLSSSSSDEDIGPTPPYIMAKKIKWRMPRRITFISQNMSPKNSNKNSNMRVNPIAAIAAQSRLSTQSSPSTAHLNPVAQSSSGVTHSSIVTSNAQANATQPQILIMPVPVPVPMNMPINPMMGQPIYYNQQNTQHVSPPVIQNNLPTSFNVPPPSFNVPPPNFNTRPVFHNVQRSQTNNNSVQPHVTKYRAIAPKNTSINPFANNNNYRSNEAQSYVEHKERKKAEEEKRRKIAYEKATKAAQEDKLKKIEEANNTLRKDDENKRKTTRWNEYTNNIAANSVQSKPQLSVSKPVTTFSTSNNRTNTKKIKPLIRPIQNNYLINKNKEQQVNNDKQPNTHNSFSSNTPPPSPIENEKEKTPEKMIEIPADALILSDDDMTVKIDDDSATVAIDDDNTSQIDNRQNSSRKSDSNTIQIDSEGSPASQLNKSKSLDSIPATVRIDNDSEKYEQVIEKEKENEELPVVIKQEIKQEKLDSPINEKEHEADTESDTSRSSNESFYEELKRVFKEEDFLRLVKYFRPQEMIEMSSQEKVQNWMENMPSPNHDQVDDDDDIWEKSGEDFGDSQDSLVPFEPSSQIVDKIKSEPEDFD